ncbi:hypothetical protein SAMN03159417_02826 [Ralstonia sp. NFACC01]|jgi:hypothetical protein|nr:hypothetical protein SAMN03159417_02826 [Ralstonia sp. NFACC01]
MLRSLFLSAKFACAYIYANLMSVWKNPSDFYRRLIVVIDERTLTG